MNLNCKFSRGFCAKTFCWQYFMFRSLLNAQSLHSRVETPGSWRSPQEMVAFKICIIIIIIKVTSWTEIKLSFHILFMATRHLTSFGLEWYTSRCKGMMLKVWLLPFLHGIWHEVDILFLFNGIMGRWLNRTNFTLSQQTASDCVLACQDYV